MRFLVALAVLVNVCLASMPLNPPPSLMWEKFMDKKVESRNRLRARGEIPLPTESHTGSSIMCENGVLTFNNTNYPCNGIQLQSYLSLQDLGANILGYKGAGNDIWGWVSDDGKEIAIVGTETGSAFVDVTDPNNPFVYGFMQSCFDGADLFSCSHGPDFPCNAKSQHSIWRDMKINGNHVYIGSEAFGHGVQIYDMTQLFDIKEPSKDFAISPDQIYCGVDDVEFGSSHNIVINEDTDTLYVVGSFSCRGGPHVVDISDPENPTFLGCVAQNGYTHDSQCIIYNGPDKEFVGEEICFDYDEDSLAIVHMPQKKFSNLDCRLSDPQPGCPIFLAHVPYDGCVYSHQGWVTSDHSYLLLDDELDEVFGKTLDGRTKTFMWDITDLRNPTVIDYFLSSEVAIDHNLYIHTFGDDELALQSNYEAGLRVLNVNDIANGNIYEEKYFDCHPESNEDEFRGSWSLFLFPSENIVLNSIERGLYVLRFQDK